MNIRYNPHTVIRSALAYVLDPPSVLAVSCRATTGEEIRGPAIVLVCILN